MLHATGRSVSFFYRKVDIKPSTILQRCSHEDETGNTEVGCQVADSNMDISETRAGTRVDS